MMRLFEAWTESLRREEVSSDNDSPIPSDLAGWFSHDLERFVNAPAKSEK